jgi:hypothetical protein
MKMVSVNKWVRKPKPPYKAGRTGETVFLME